MKSMNVFLKIYGIIVLCMSLISFNNSVRSIIDDVKCFLPSNKLNCAQDILDDINKKNALSAKTKVKEEKDESEFSQFHISLDGKFVYRYSCSFDFCHFAEVQDIQKIFHDYT